VNFIEPAGDPGYRQRIAGDEPARGISRNAIAGDETPDADDAALVALVAQMLPEDQSGQALAAFQRIARDDDDEITRKPVASIVDRAKALWSMVRLIGARLDGELDDRLPLFRHAVRALRGDQTFDDSVEPHGAVGADRLLHDERRHRLLVLRGERGDRRLQRLARGLALGREHREDRLEPRRADRGWQAAVARLVDVIPVQARVVAGAPDRQNQQFRRGGDIVPRVPIPGVPPLASILDDRYRLLRELGRGGMGVVYAAEATRLGDRPCAVKLLRPEFTHDAVAVARFRREAAVAARIKHSNVVEIFDTGTTASGLGYIAMELLTGETLAHTLRRAGRLPWTRVRRLLLQICGALAAAHAQQVVHRDMKPDNCLLLGADEPDEIHQDPRLRDRQADLRRRPAADRHRRAGRHARVHVV
jgi:hypothetical protein